jgi:hypothetical protein
MKMKIVEIHQLLLLSFSHCFFAVVGSSKIPHHEINSKQFCPTFFISPVVFTLSFLMEWFTVCITYVDHTTLLNKPRRVVQAEDLFASIVDVCKVLEERSFEICIILLTFIKHNKLKLVHSTLYLLNMCSDFRTPCNCMCRWACHFLCHWSYIDKFYFYAYLSYKYISFK